ncbi:hypothetical protein GE061_007865 [Apolygus lucorum]|uniref:Uncharacterized protein n=1 Tax=Apolygus lucorum TaxID=248454 RepID=A0A8S9WPR3_APOLU|nr:hypothetical protein GE061_007865 [Apolygus lucorum]
MKGLIDFNLPRLRVEVQQIFKDPTKSLPPGKLHEKLVSTGSIVVYPEFAKLLKFHLTLPTSTTEGKEAETTYRRIKTFCRVTRGVGELFDLDYLFIENDLVLDVTEGAPQKDLSNVDISALETCNLQFDFLDAILLPERQHDQQLVNLDPSKSSEDPTLLDIKPVQIDNTLETCNIKFISLDAILNPPEPQHDQQLVNLDPSNSSEDPTLLDIKPVHIHNTLETCNLKISLDAILNPPEPQHDQQLVNLDPSNSSEDPTLLDIKPVQIHITGKSPPNCSKTTKISKVHPKSKIPPAKRPAKGKTYSKIGQKLDAILNPPEPQNDQQLVNLDPSNSSEDPTLLDIKPVQIHNTLETCNLKFISLDAILNAPEPQHHQQLVNLEPSKSSEDPTLLDIKPVQIHNTLETCNLKFISLDAILNPPEPQHDQQLVNLDPSNSSEDPTLLDIKPVHIHNTLETCNLKFISLDAILNPPEPQNDQQLVNLDPSNSSEDPTLLDIKPVQIHITGKSPPNCSKTTKISKVRPKSKIPPAKRPAKGKTYSKIGQKLDAILNPPEPQNDQQLVNLDPSNSSEDPTLLDIKPVQIHNTLETCNLKFISLDAILNAPEPQHHQQLVNLEPSKSSEDPTLLDIKPVQIHNTLETCNLKFISLDAILNPPEPQHHQQLVNLEPSKSSEDPTLLDIKPVQIHNTLETCNLKFISLDAILNPPEPQHHQQLVNLEPSKSSEDPTLLDIKPVQIQNTEISPPNRSKTTKPTKISKKRPKSKIPPAKRPAKGKSYSKIGQKLDAILNPPEPQHDQQLVNLDPSNSSEDPTLLDIKPVQIHNTLETCNLKISLDAILNPPEPQHDQQLVNLDPSNDSEDPTLLDIKPVQIHNTLETCNLKISLDAILNPPEPQHDQQLVNLDPSNDSEDPTLLDIKPVQIHNTLETCNLKISLDAILNPPEPQHDQQLVNLDPSNDSEDPTLLDIKPVQIDTTGKSPPNCSTTTKI